jgi:hypothetical protein
MAGKLPANAFQKGCAPGPGRPKGSRTRLQEFVIEMLDEDFREHGHEVLERVRAKWPQVYLTAVINLMPKQTQTETVSQLEHLTDAELDLLERMLASERAETVQAIDVVAESNDAIIDVPPLSLSTEKQDKT